MSAFVRNIRAPVHLLYALSGAASLGYQVCWFRIFVGEFGSGALTFALVVSSFIGGLGLGAVASRPFADRLSRGWLGRRLQLDAPLRLYGAVEWIVVATASVTLLAGAVGSFAADPFPYVLTDGIWSPGAGQWLLRAGAIAALVFVPCFFMGVTFPLLCRAFASDDRFPSGLYAANTLGACVGVLACEFLLFPTLGHEAAFVFWLALNAALGSSFLFTRLGRGEAPSESVAAVGAPLAPSGSVATYATLLGLALASGFLTGALEVDVVRRLRFTGFRTEAALSFVSFWAVAAIFLGSATMRIWRRHALRWAQWAAAAALAAYLAVWQLLFIAEDAVVASFSPAAPAIPADLPAALLGLYAGQGGLGSTVIFTGILVFPTLYLLSWLLPAVCDRLHAEGRHLGVAYGLNTLAFCAGTLAFGWVAPRVDVFYSTQLFLNVFALGAVLIFLLGSRWGRSVALPALLVAGGGAAAVVLTPGGVVESYFRPGDPASVGRVSALRADAATTTFVVDEGRARHLYFDAFSMSATTPGAQRYMRLMAHFPLLAHPDPKRALVICFGVGNTASAVAAHEGIEQLDVVDLNRQVFRTASEFAYSNALVYRDPRVRLIHDDGRRFLSSTDQRYDLITSEPPPPRHEGIYRLYSKEYYEAARERLTPSGMMTQWLTVRQMPGPAVDLAIRSFVSVFPHTLLFVGAQYDFVLLGSNAPIDLRNVEQRYGKSARVRADLQGIEVRSVIGLLARVVRSDRQLREDVGPGRMLSDLRNDWSYVFFGGEGVPEIAYDPLALWEELGIEELENASALSRVTRSLGLLRSHVRDFPLASLATVAATPGATQILGSDVDWEVVHGLNESANAARLADRLDDAEKRYRDSLALVPDQIQVWIWLADVLERKSARGAGGAAASEAWAQYVHHNPDDAWGRFRLGAALLVEGEPSRARVQLEGALALSPGSREVERALAEAIRREREG